MTGVNLTNFLLISVVSIFKFYGKEGYCCPPFFAIKFNSLLVFRRLLLDDAMLRKFSICSVNLF